MGKSDRKKDRSRKKKKTHQELLLYVANNINDLPYKERKFILKLIAIDIGLENIYDCADGCRLVLGGIEKQTLDTILDIIVVALG